MFDSLVYGKKISRLLKENKNQENPWFIYFAALTKVYPQDSKSKDIVRQRRQKIKELDSALELV